MRVLLLGFSLCWLLPSAARGQEDAAAVAAQAEKDARARRFAEAVAGFKRAYELSPDPAYLYNVGVLSLVGLKDAAQAWEYATAYGEKARTPAERKDAEELVAKAEAALRETHGRIEVRASPPDAAVFLDRRDPDARMKRSVAWVVPGVHNLMAEAPGYEPAEVQVTVKQGVKTEVAMVLRPQAARLRVESRTPNATVFVDGEAMGPAPAEKSVSPGEHTVRAEAAGHRPLEQTVKLGPGEHLVVHADLERVGDTRRAAMAPSAKMPPMKVAGWALVGSGAALAVTGSVLFALAARDNRAAADLDIASYPTVKAYNEEFDALIAKRDDKATMAYVTWGLGGAAAVTGVVLLLVRPAGGAAVLPSGPSGTPGLSASFVW